MTIMTIMSIMTAMTALTPLATLTPFTVVTVVVTAGVDNFNVGHIANARPFYSVEQEKHSGGDNSFHFQPLQGNVLTIHNDP
jgi:hypothetical protein